MPINLPEKCLRNLTDCQPLSQVQSCNGVSFICCGINDGTTRKVLEDVHTVCWKNEDIDEISHWDRRDIIDTISVLSQALSVVENWRVSQGEEIDG